MGFQYGRDFGGVRAEAEYSYLNFDGSDGFEISAHDFMPVYFSSLRLVSVLTFARVWVWELAL